MSGEAARLTMAAMLTALYLLLVVATVRGQRRRTVPAASAACLVAYASQTGTARYLAEQSARTLQAGGIDAACVDVADLDAARLLRTSRLLVVASTCGEGDAPDSAARLTRLLADGQLSLAGLQVGVLALGDASYRHFCGYGRALEQQLQARGASLLFPRIEADRRAPAALAGWQHQLRLLAGNAPGAGAADWDGPPFDDWRIVTRSHVNPGSAGAPVWRIVLRPAAGALPEWQAGDLAQVLPPAAASAANGAARDYSIASLHSENALELLVRLHLRQQGHGAGLQQTAQQTGAVSGWLCHQAGPADPVRLRVIAHPNFRLGENAGRPLILIGNGTGIAGLRGLLKSRIDAGEKRNWLLFGERNVAFDRLYGDDLDAWQRNGGLARLDLAYSRDGAGAYVQALMAANGKQLLDWIAGGAAVYVCGNLQGMADAVHRHLLATLGADGVALLHAQGRYRRDVY